VNWAGTITILKAQRQTDSMCSWLLRGRGEGLIELLKRERQAALSYATSPSPWAWMVPLTLHHHPDSKLLTDIPDPGARTNPDSRDTSTITMLEVDLFPVYLRDKIKKRVSPSFPFPPPPYSACRMLSQAAQPGPGPRQSPLLLTEGR